MKRFIRGTYVLNMCAGIAVLTYFTQRQEKGDFRCNTVSGEIGPYVVHYFLIHSIEASYSICS